MTESLPAPRIATLAADRDPPPLNIFRTLAHNKALYKGFLALGSHLLRDSVLPAREREIVILRTGWRCASEYEFGQHTVIGGQAGLSTDEIARLAEAGPGEWAAADAVLIAMVDELCDHDMVSDATWSSLAARWDDGQLLELLVLAGYYRLVSGMLNSAGVALETGTPGWPEAATPSRRAPRESPS